MVLCFATFRFAVLQLFLTPTPSSFSRRDEKGNYRRYVLEPDMTATVAVIYCLCSPMLFVLLCLLRPATTSLFSDVVRPFFENFRVQIVLFCRFRHVSVCTVWACVSSPQQQVALWSHARVVLVVVVVGVGASTPQPLFLGMPHRARHEAITWCEVLACICFRWKPFSWRVLVSSCRHYSTWELFSTSTVSFLLFILHLSIETW